MLLCTIKCPFYCLILFAVVTVFACVVRGCLLIVIHGPAGRFATVFSKIIKFLTLEAERKTVSSYTCR